MSAATSIAMSGVALTAFLLLAACSATVDAPAARSDQPPATGSPLPEAAALYQRKCSKCHEAYPPTAYSDEEWEDHLAEYAPRAGLKKDSRPAVLAWLQASNGR